MIPFQAGEEDPKMALSIYMSYLLTWQALMIRSDLASSTLPAQYKFFAASAPLGALSHAEGSVGL
jgi:hypothetical protein